MDAPFTPAKRRPPIALRAADWVMTKSKCATTRPEASTAAVGRVHDFAPPSAQCRWKRTLTASAVAAIFVVAVVAPMVGSSGGQMAGASAHSAPPVTVCGNGSLLNGPSSAPAGAVTVAAGDDGAVTLGTPGKTYWFAPGTHTLGNGEYDQIHPGDGDVYEGAPGAILSGQGTNDFAFVGHSTKVTIEYLTITDFASPSTEGVVNHTAASGWTITHDTVKTSTAGAGVEIGSTDQVVYDCLTRNRQYGFNAYSTKGTVENVTLSDDEISFNDGTGTDHLPTTCGCTGGGKFWNTIDAKVDTDYVHTNGDPGIWVDTDNAGFQVQHDYFAHNFAAGLMYEVSYNATISHDTFVGNGIGEGPTNPSFPTSAIYVSESGGDPRVHSHYAGLFNVKGNLFTNNYGGVVVWENANRHCGDGSDGMCTLVTRSTYTVAACSAHLKGSKPTQTPDFYDNCRWKSQNVLVEDNTFNFTPTAVGKRCTKANDCGMNGLFSEYGTTTPWRAWVVPQHISDDQSDHFKDNTYAGPWHFVGFALGNTMSWAQWTKGETTADSSGHPFYGQDSGSTYNRIRAAAAHHPAAAHDH